MKLLITLALLITITSFMHKNSQNDDTIFFTSLNYAIQQGQYDGVAPVGQLREQGDFGLGSEEKLAGELIILDGTFYSIDSAGQARIMDDQDMISFAAIKQFAPEQQTTLERVDNLNDLEQQLAQLINSNAFAAIKIHGQFNAIVFRSFEQQQKPYQPVDKVREITFERKHISGTMVGYYTPESALVMNSPVFHFHFIDDSKKTGGHVLECELRNALMEIDYAKEVHIQLPDTTITEHVELNEQIKQKG